MDDIVWLEQVLGALIWFEVSTLGCLLTPHSERGLEATACTMID